MQWLVVVAVLSWIISAYVKAQKKRKSVTISKLLSDFQERQERERLQEDELLEEDEEEESVNSVVDTAGHPEYQEGIEALQQEGNSRAAAARETGSLEAEGKVGGGMSEIYVGGVRKLTAHLPCLVRLKKSSREDFRSFAGFYNAKKKSGWRL